MFWAEGFWAAGFWADDFWIGLTTAGGGVTLSEELYSRRGERRRG